MSTLNDPEVAALLDARNHAVISTVGDGGEIHSAVVWQERQGDTVSVNSAVGRRWPTDLDRNPTVTLLVVAEGNPYEYVEIRGRASGTTDGADEQINRLAKKYIDQDEYPFRQPGEQRITYTITPDRVRYQKQG